MQFTICHKMAMWGQKYAQSTTTLFPCDSSFFHRHIDVVNVKVASIHFPTQLLNNGALKINHVQTVPALGAIPSQGGHYGVALDL